MVVDYYLSQNSTGPPKIATEGFDVFSSSTRSNGCLDRKESVNA